MVGNVFRGRIRDLFKCPMTERGQSSRSTDVDLATRSKAWYQGVHGLKVVQPDRPNLSRRKFTLAGLQNNRDMTARLIAKGPSGFSVQNKGASLDHPLN